MVGYIKLEIIFLETEAIVFTTEAGDTEYKFSGFFKRSRKTKEVV